jgi:hypothetical protein
VLQFVSPEATNLDLAGSASSARPISETGLGADSLAELSAEALLAFLEAFVSILDVDLVPRIWLRSSSAFAV